MQLHRFDAAVGAFIVSLSASLLSEVAGGRSALRVAPQDDLLASATLARKQEVEPDEIVPPVVRNKYNEDIVKRDETPIIWEDKSALPFSVEAICACSFIGLIASVPLLMACASKHAMTKYHYFESIALLLWLGGAVFLFTSVLMFNSVHFKQTRCLTIVESVYLLAQVITTVGYGDIVPAYPRGQVCLAVYVLFALLFYGGLMMELSGILVDRAEDAATYIKDRAGNLTHRLAENTGLHESEVVQSALAAVSAREVEKTSPRRSPRTPRFNPVIATRLHAIDFQPFIKSGMLFMTITVIGVLFWHYFPGENKTWLQAVYMSIITLSTVGFGAFTADTEGGKVFGAFWMIFGVTAMGAVMGSVVDLVLAHKISDRHRTKEEKERYDQLVRECSTPGMGMDKYAFLKCELLHADLVNEDVLQEIEDKFNDMGPNDQGCLSARKVVDKA